MGRSLCSYELVKARDPRLQSTESVDQCLQILSFLRLVTQVTLPRESLHWLVFNGKLIGCVPLRPHTKPHSHLRLFFSHLDSDARPNNPVRSAVHFTSHFLTQTFTVGLSFLAGTVHIYNICRHLMTLGYSKMVRFLFKPNATK